MIRQKIINLIFKFNSFFIDIQLEKTNRDLDEMD